MNTFIVKSYIINLSYSSGADCIIEMSDIERLLEVAIERQALLFGEFKLSSGGTTNYYFDGRLLTLNPEGAYLTAKCFLPIIYQCNAEALAGPTLGAYPIVSAVSTLSYIEGKPVPALIVRKEKKTHGGGRNIEGYFYRGQKVAVVDDTCTTGGGLFHAIEAVENEGCEVVKVLSIMDRMAGGSEELKRRGYEFQSLFVANDKGEIHINPAMSS